MAVCENCGKELNENGECVNCKNNDSKTTEAEATQVHTNSVLSQIKDNIIMMFETPKALTILVILMIVSVLACVFFKAQLGLFEDSSVIKSTTLFFIIWIVLAVIVGIFLVVSIICNIKRKNTEKNNKK